MKTWQLFYVRDEQCQLAGLMASVKARMAPWHPETKIAQLWKKSKPKIVQSWRKVVLDIENKYCSIVEKHCPSHVNQRLFNCGKKLSSTFKPEIAHLWRKQIVLDISNKNYSVVEKKCPWHLNKFAQFWNKEWSSAHDIGFSVISLHTSFRTWPLRILVVTWTLLYTFQLLQSLELWL